MNCSIFFMFFALVTQIGDVLPAPFKELLPAPNGEMTSVASVTAAPSSPISPPGRLVRTQINGKGYEVGWKTDETDNKFCMVLHIAPAAMANFADGANGNEMQIEVPAELRGLVIEKVIVRGSTAAVERIPLNPMPIGNNPRGAAGSNAYLQNLSRGGLANSSPVNIDRPTEVMPTTGGSALGSLLATTPTIPTTPQTNFQSNDPSLSVMPPGTNSQPISPPGVPSGAGAGFANGQNNNFGTSAGLGANLGGTNTNTGFNPTSSGLSTPNDMYTNQNQNGSLAQKDSFSSTANQARPNIPSGLDILRNNPQTQGYANSGSQYSNGPAPYANSNNPIANTRPTNAPFASNLPTTGGMLQAPPPIQYNTQPPLTQQPTFAQAPIQPPQNNYANGQGPYYSASNYPSLASRNTGGAILPPGADSTLDDPAAASKDKLLPFMLLFSIVGNVYLGLWMSHLRSRYRQLLSNMRGIPVADLDN